LALPQPLAPPSPGGDTASVVSSSAVVASPSPSALGKVLGPLLDSGGATVAPAPETTTTAVATVAATPPPEDSVEAQWTPLWWALGLIVFLLAVIAVGSWGRRGG
jgi:hypothetical protein